MFLPYNDAVDVVAHAVFARVGVLFWVMWTYWKRVVQTAALAGFQVVRGSACLLRDPFWIETPVGYS